MLIMNRKAVSGIIVLTLLLTGMLVLVFNVQPVKGVWSGTVYIRADGSIDPPTANITTTDNVTYTFTGNINDFIVVERNNTIINGADYTLQGTLGEGGTGIDLSGRSNITIKNTNIIFFYDGIDLLHSSNTTITGNSIQVNGVYGIYHYGSSNTTITGNNITNSNWGILFYGSSGNTISGNNIRNNLWGGIWLEDSSNNTVSGNTFINNGLIVLDSYENVIEDNTVNGKPLVYLEEVQNYSVGDAGQVILVNCNNITVQNLNLVKATVGVELWHTNNTKIKGNNIANNRWSIHLYGSSKNSIYHNNFINNPWQVHNYQSVNVWDDSYPSGGNYWSDYAGTDLCRGSYQNETGSDGIGDTPYIIDENNTDNYPLMKPYAGPHDVGIRSFEISKTVVGQGYNVNMTATIINYGEQTETFNLTIQANSTTLYTLTQTLTSRNSTTVTFTWNTTDVAKGKYTITVNVTSVPSETDLADNTFVYGVVTVTIIGDVDGDRDVDIYDVVKITGIYGSQRGDPQFNPNSDLDDDGEIKIYDVVRCTSHYGQSG